MSPVSPFFPKPVLISMFSHQQEVTHTPFCVLRLHPFPYMRGGFLHWHLHPSTMSLPYYAICPCSYYTSLAAVTSTPPLSAAPPPSFLFSPPGNPLPLLLHSHLLILIPPASPPCLLRPSPPPLTPLPPLQHPRSLSPPLPLPSSVCHRPQK